MKHFKHFQYEKETATTLVQDPETGVIRKATKISALMLLSRIFFQAFTLTFLAEWGDRSQLTTIILAAREVINHYYSFSYYKKKSMVLKCRIIYYFQDVYGVVIGGILGHMFCTGLAVLGGRMIAQKISVRTGKIYSNICFCI